MKPNFDYSKTMMMKIGIGSPDNKGGCKLVNTFPEVLEKIRIMDAVTFGAPKIVYLVGWQYNGHDDRYPAFFEVNEHAKCPDKSAHESLLWLIEEAKRYHTTVSLHINLSDAYKESELWQEYVDNDLILKRKNGELKPTGTWNGRTAYQVRFSQEWKSGFFKKRVDGLFDLLPLADMGTIHVDAFFVRKGKDTTIQEEKAARRKMIEYFGSRGVDLTSEFIYREMNCGYRSLWGKSDVIGLIPAFWHLRMTQRDYEKYPPQLVAGGSLNMDIQADKGLHYLFYGNAHGEGTTSGDGWWKSFLHEFATMSVPYFYLNAHKLQKISGCANSRVAYFSGGVETHIKGQRIIENGSLVKQEETLMLPVHWLEKAYLAYSKKPADMTFAFPFTGARVQSITENGLSEETHMTANGSITLHFDDDTAYLIKGE